MEQQRPEERVNPDTAQIDILLSALSSFLKEVQTTSKDTEKQLTDRIQVLEQEQKSLEENMGVIKTLLEKTVKYDECKDQLAKKTQLLLEAECKIQQIEEENAQLKKSMGNSRQLLQRLETEQQTAESISRQLTEAMKQIEDLGPAFKKYLEIAAIICNTNERNWLEDAAVKGIFSQNYAVFYGNCGNKERVIKFYNNVAIRLSAANAPYMDEYCALLNLILDFCVTACGEINQISLQRQQVKPGDPFDFYCQQDLTGGGGQYRSVREVVLQGIETREGIVFNDIKALVKA